MFLYDFPILENENCENFGTVMEWTETVIIHLFMA